MKKKIDVYCISKPLQFFNVKNMPFVKGAGNYRVLVVDCQFKDAEIFAENVKKNDSSWDEVRSVSGKNQLFSLLMKMRVNYLFTENDASFKVFIYMLLGRALGRVKRLYVFEEGIGSYSDRLFGTIKGSLYDYVGIGSHYGTSCFCDGLYLNLPDLYNEKYHSQIAVPLELPFIEAIKKYYVLFSNCFDALPSYLDIKNSRILLYVTSWEINKEVLNKIDEVRHDYDLIVIKPHPHIKGSLWHNSEYKILETSNLVEMILIKLLEQKNKITVFHESSTSVVYFENVINCVNFNRIEVYEELCRYINNF